MSTNPVISAVIDMLLEKLMLDGPVDDTQKDILIEVGSNELQGVGFGTDKGWRALKYIIDCMASIKIVDFPKISYLSPQRQFPISKEEYEEWLRGPTDQEIERGMERSRYAEHEEDERLAVLEISRSFPQECKKLRDAENIRDRELTSPNGTEISKDRIVDKNVSLFNLTKNGIFSRENPRSKDKECKMEEGSDRYKVMWALVSHTHTRRYVPTKNLSEELDLNEKRVRTAVSELRKRFCDHFSGIRNLDIIESKKGSGYRINLNIEIVEQ
jgi:biotin operon repressor